MFGIATRGDSSEPRRGCRTRLYWLVVALLPASAFGADENVDIWKQLAKEESRLQIRIVHQGDQWEQLCAADNLSARPAPRDVVEKYLPLLLEELKKYPPELVKFSQMEWVVICRQLKYGKQLRAAIPGFRQKALYLDLERGGYSRAYQRGVIHHEFYHLVDYRDDGQLRQDAGWAALNAPTFRYGAGGDRVQNDPTQSLFIDRSGFLTKYSMSAVEEDKAELFCHLLLNPGPVADRLANDPVLAAKVRLLQSRLKQHCPATQRDFWPTMERQR